MVACDQQEEVLSSQKVLLWIFLQIRNLIWRHAELNRLLVGSGIIPLNIKLQQDGHTVCCGHNTVSREEIDDTDDTDDTDHTYDTDDTDDADDTDDSDDTEICWNRLK